ncbi:MAG: TonB-dependent vitamin B12 receptor [Gammaproteobacteria bacterium]|nr:TonB-dependent vitamin B12 receptor [Gammaproteobacteria bacterium]
MRSSGFTSLFSFSLLALAVSPVQATDAVEHMVITANRTAQTVNDTLAPVTIIERADIERLQPANLPELLRGLPGINISNNGGAGKQTSLFLRGSNSSHLLVLIDGVKVGSATLGTAALQNIPVHQIERIEIVRGPRSALYGSEAIGGVIQIFTRRGDGEVFGGDGALWGGSFGTFGGSANLRAGNGQGWFNAGVSSEQTDGYNACDPNVGAGCYADEPDKDGNRYVSGQLRAGYHFSDRASLELNALRTDSDTDYDGTYTNESKTREQTLSLLGRYAPNARWDSSLLLAESRDESDNYLNGTYGSSTNTKRYLMSWQNDWHLREQDLLTLGVDWQDDRISGSASYAESSRHNLGIFSQYLLTLGVHDLQLALRNDDNQQYGDHNTGSIAWGAPLADGLRVTASYGTAFKAPTFNDLYYPYSGNPALHPEESKTVEVGLRGDQVALWSVNLYQTDADQLIDWLRDDSTGMWAPANISEARMRGIELAATHRIDRWTLGAWGTWLNAENRSSGYFGKQLPRRAEQSARFDVDYGTGLWSLGASWLLEGERFDDQGNSISLPGYGLVDLRGSYDLSAAWQLQLKLGNLFDQQYQTAAWYNQAERNATLTIRYQP